MSEYRRAGEDCGSCRTPRHGTDLMAYGSCDFTGKCVFQVGVPLAHFGQKKFNWRPPASTHSERHPCFAGVFRFLGCCDYRIWWHFRSTVLRIVLRISGPLNRCLEMLVCDLQIMLAGDRLGVPQPLADDMRREPVRQIGLSRSRQVVLEPRPGRHPGFLNQFQKLLAEIDAGPEPFCRRLERIPLLRQDFALNLGDGFQLRLERHFERPQA